MTPPRVVLAAIVLCSGAAAAQSRGVVSSKHDLSVTGGGAIRAQSETQVCVFCHVGHSQRPLGDNRPDLRADYVPYQSSTMRSVVPASPTGASRTCLSCHDGTIALGETVATGTIEMLPTAPGGRLPPSSPSNLGTDLRRTHPVSFAPAPDRRHHAPPEGSKARLDRNGQVQCTSCHDPHMEKNDPLRGKFLIASNRYSAMCLSCHTVDYWNTGAASHQVSVAQLPPGLAEKYPYSTVTENGCESCHRSHAASSHGRLLRVADTEQEQKVCLDCHNGRVAKTDLVRELSKGFAHTMPATLRPVHDQAEGPKNEQHRLPEGKSSTPRHVTCVDCHNPHASSAQRTDGLRVSGALAGVWGIDQSGERVEQVNFEYEVCFKCHGDSANQSRAKGLARTRPQREQPTQNLRLAFAPEAVSAHPVVAPSRGDSPSLKPEYSRAKQFACSACHASDTGPGVDGKSPAGPHGSDQEFMLERNLATADFTPESPTAYALCYKCHERDEVLSERSPFPQHRRHVVDAATPCTACHASHGVPALFGAMGQGLHLIDFDLNIVERSPSGLREYRSRGLRTGACSTSCHGVVHEETQY